MSKRFLEDFAKAIEKNDSKSIKSLLSKGKVDANAHLPRDHDPSALDFAVRKRRDNIVELLLNAGARIDDVDARGESICHAAVIYGNIGVLRMLLARGANFDLKNNEGITALHLAISELWRNEEIALLLLDAGASLEGVDRGDLCEFAALSTTVIQALVDRGIVIGDLRGRFNKTSLQFATHRCRTESSMAVLSKLIECGVDLEARASEHEHWVTCTGLAIVTENDIALRHLLLAGGDVDCVDHEGEPLLHKAAMQNRYACLMLFLAAGADVTSRDRNRRTACHIAVDHRTRFVHLLVAAGADLDTADHIDQTPRMSLAEYGMTIDPEQVELARRDIAKTRLDFVRHRAMEVCIGLQSLRLDALQLCEILQHSCGPLARFIAFHQWWKFATTVKHKTREQL
jgi:ankyrin repeat protein